MYANRFRVQYVSKKNSLKIYLTNFLGSCACISWHVKSREALYECDMSLLDAYVTSYKNNADTSIPSPIRLTDERLNNQVLAS